MEFILSFMILSYVFFWMAIKLYKCMNRCHKRK